MIHKNIFFLSSMVVALFYVGIGTVLAKKKSSNQVIAPVLQLNPEGHMGEITVVSFTPDGKHLLSSGLDKQVRVWNLETGKTERIIRGEIGSGSHGQINTIALSPDKKWLTVAGWLGSDEDGNSKEGLKRVGVIRLYDFKTGKLVKLLKGHHSTVMKVVFSPNGKKMASVAGTRLIVWDVKSWEVLYQREDHADWVNIVNFSPDNKYVVTGSDDATMIVRDVSSGKKVSHLQGHTKAITNAIISPDGKQLFSISKDRTIRVWNLKDGKLLRIVAKLPVQPADMVLSPDGKSLVSSNYDEDYKNYNVTVRDSQTGKKQLIYVKHLNKVPSLAISSDGKWVASVDINAHEIHVWNLKTGKVRHIFKSLGNTVWALGFSADGKSIAFGKTKKRDSQTVAGPLEFRMKLPTLDRPLGVPRVMTNVKAYPIRASDKRRGYSLKRFKTKEFDLYGKLEVYRKRKKVGSVIRTEQDGYAHESYTITPDGKKIISGAKSGALSIYNLKGKKLGNFVGHTDTVYSVAVSPNGKLLLSGSADQTLRLWNIKTRKLIVSMFHSRGGEWIIWTKQGYYSSSPNGDRFIGWQMNKGAAKTPRYIVGSQLKEKFYRPDIVEKAILLSSGKKAVKQARNTRFALKDLGYRSPPDFDIVSPYQNQRFEKAEVLVSLRLKASPDPIKHFEISANGVQVVTRSLGGLKPINNKGKELTRHFKINLMHGRNIIKIKAVNAVGNKQKTLQLYYNARKNTVFSTKRGTLFLVAIGVNNYPNIPKICNTSDGSCDLKYAGKDAFEFYSLMKKSVGGLHNKVKGFLLVNQGVAPKNIKVIEPLKANIEDVFDELREATSNDTIVLFLAGHGVNDASSNNYYFLPTDAKRHKNRWRQSSIVRWQMLQNALQDSKGRRLMFVDTCHSGNAYNARLIKDSADANIVVLSATDANTLAQELESLKNGVFTHSILAAFKNSYLLRDKKIKILELTNFVSEEVETLTKNTQQPQTSLAGVTNFTLGQKVN